MKRLSPLVVLILLGGTAMATYRSAGAAATVKPAAVTPQNIVFIVTDDETYAETQDPAVNTNLNLHIADHGISFDNGIIPNPLCCPSRVSILRGQLSSRTGVWTDSGTYGGWAAAKSHGDESSTIATWLNGAGYRTGLVGKYLNGYGSPWTVPPGWDYWRGENTNDGGGGYYNYYLSNQGVPEHHGSMPQDYSADVMTGFATSFITTTPAAQPLFLYVGYRAPHLPRTPAPRYLKDPRCNGANTDTLPDFGVPGTGAPHYLTTLKNPKTSVGTTDPEQACRSLLAVDDGIGSIVNTLSATGRLTNTLLVYISDNGYMYGEHRWVAKRVPYESSIHVPLVIRDDALLPSNLQGSTNSAGIAANIDLASTAAAVAGVSIPANVPQDGTSLVPVLNGSATTVRDGILLEGYSPEIQPTMPSYCGWRTTRYVFVEYSTGERSLFDLSVDPYELTNVIGNSGYGRIAGSLQALAEDACTPRPPDWPAG